MSRKSKTDIYKENIREMKNSENMTPPNVASSSNREAGAKKRLPLGDLKKSRKKDQETVKKAKFTAEFLKHVTKRKLFQNSPCILDISGIKECAWMRDSVDKENNNKELLLKVNKCAQLTSEIHVKTAEKRKVSRDKKEVCTSVNIKKKTVSTVNEKTTLFDIKDIVEKDQETVEKANFTAEFFKHVTKRELFGNSPCILDISGIKECAWIRDSVDKENNNTINIVEANASSEASSEAPKVANEASCIKNTNDQKKKDFTATNYNESNGRVELTERNFDYYLEKGKEQRIKAFLDKLSKENDNTLANYLEHISFKNLIKIKKGHKYNYKSKEPQIAIDELPSTSKESREISHSDDSINLPMNNVPLNKTYIIKVDDGTGARSYNAKLPVINSSFVDSSEIEDMESATSLVRKMSIQETKIDTYSNCLESPINVLPETKTSNGFSIDTRANSNELKKTPSHVFNGDFPHRPVVKNIKYSFKRPSSRELPLRASQLPVLAARLTQESGSFEDVLQNSTLKSDPEALIYSLEYLEDIITHLLARERQMAAPPSAAPKYNITEINRSIIVNWLVKLNTRLKDGLELLEAGVRLFDRCNVRASTPPEDLQLLGATCYWLAQKLVGVGPPRNARKMSRRCGGAFDAAELIRGERQVLRLLAWPAVPVQAETFLQYVLRVSNPERPQVALSIARYLLIAALLNTRLAALPPSRLAPAAAAAALRFCAHDDWLAFWTCKLCDSVEDIITLEKELLDVAKVIGDPHCLCREPFYLFCQSRHHAAALRVTAALDKPASNDS